MILRHVFRRLVLLHDIIVSDVHPSVLEPTLLLFPCTCMFNMWYPLHINFGILPFFDGHTDGYQSYGSIYHHHDICSDIAQDLITLKSDFDIPVCLIGDFNARTGLLDDFLHIENEIQILQVLIE